MGLFGNNYAKAGPGVAKDGPRKKRFFLFWELYFRKFWPLLKLNMLYFLFCLPIVTIGPATAGFVKVLRNYSMEKHAFLWMDFIDAFKENFKQSFVMGLIDIVLVILMYVSLMVYPQLAAQNSFYYVPYVLCLSFLLVAIMMHFYIYPMIVSVNLPLKQIIKNSFLLTCLGIKANIVTMLGLVVIFGGLFALIWYVNLFLIFLWPFVILSLAGFLVVFNSYPIVQKYVINPYYEAQGRDNPEYDYLKPLGEDDSIFEDKGGTEPPINPGSDKKKGKVVR